MSKFLCEIRSEIQVRLNSAKNERARLAKAQERIAELDATIAEAEAELNAIHARIPQEKPDVQASV